MKQLEGKRILLADDEAGIRETFGLLLEAVRAEVTLARDGLEALKLYRAGQFDCVVTDYNMPVMKGDELAITIKTANPEQRVVMVSGFPEDVKVNGRVPWFVDVLLPKPPERIRDLLDAVAPAPPVAEGEGIR